MMPREEMLHLCQMHGDVIGFHITLRDYPGIGFTEYQGSGYAQYRMASELEAKRMLSHRAGMGMLKPALARCISS